MFYIKSTLFKNFLKFIYDVHLILPSSAKELNSDFKKSLKLLYFAYKILSFQFCNVN